MLPMADRKRSHVWNLFSSENSNNAVCNICGKTVRYCGNTTNLVKHLRSNHRAEHDVMQQRSEEEEKAGAAWVRQTSLAESFGGGSSIQVHRECNVSYIGDIYHSP